MLLKIYCKASSQNKTPKKKPPPFKAAMAGVTPMPPQMKTRCCGSELAVRYSPLGSSRGLNSPPQPLDRWVEVRTCFFYKAKKWEMFFEKFKETKEIFFPMEIHKELQDLYIDFVLKRCQFCEIQSVPNKQRGKSSSCFFVGNLWNFSLFVSRLLLGWKTRIHRTELKNEQLI